MLVAWVSSTRRTAPCRTFARGPRRSAYDARLSQRGHVRRPRGTGPCSARRRTSRPQSNSRSIQGQFRVPAEWVQGGTPGPLLEIDTDLKRGHDRPGDCVPASRSARPRWQPTTRLRWLQGPATTEIDSPHLRSRRRLNRRVHLRADTALVLLCFGIDDRLFRRRR